jgi:catecholate siderophore receptor
MKRRSLISDVSRRKRRRGRTRLFVLGAAFAAMAMSSKAAAAQPPLQRPPAGDHRPVGGVIHFDLREAALADVLQEFARHTGLTPTLSDPALGVIRSPGVVGDFTPAEALERLLMGTSLTARRTNDGRIRIGIADVATFVNVEGRRPDVASTKFTEPLRDIPQTITVVPRAVFEEQGATSLRDVLRNVTGITFQAGEGGVPAGDQLTIRGFSARTDMFIDGVRDSGGYSRDTFNLEQVEVAKGPSSSISGRGSTGGAINHVSKTPGRARSYDASIAGGNANYKRTSVDANQPLGRSTSLRVNAMWTEAGVPGRDEVKGHRWGVAPALTIGLDSPMVLTVSHLHLEQHNVPEYGIPWVPANSNPELRAYANGAPPVDSSNYYGLVHRDYETTSTDVSTVKLDHRTAGGAVSIRNLTRYGRNDRDSVLTSPRFASVETSTAVMRQLQSRDMVDTILANQTSVVARFSTGELQHALSTGVEFSQESSENFARSGPAAAPTDLYHPNPFDPYSGPIVRTGASSAGIADSAAAYAFDTVSVGSHLEFNGGLRWERFAAETQSVAIGGVMAPFERTDHLTSWRAGVVFKPDADASVYAGYSTSANPSAEGLALGAANVALDPEAARSVEIGTKWDLARGALSATGALFRTDKINARTPGLNPGDPPTVLEGKQVVQGAEVGLSGRPSAAWTLFAGYAFMDSAIAASNTVAEIDNALALTPRHTFSLWSSYELPWRVSIGGGAQFMDAIFRNTTNTARVPSYWLFNAVGSYKVNEHMTLRVNAQNLFDTDYVDRVGGGHYIPGPGRQVLLGSDLRF